MPLSSIESSSTFAARLPFTQVRSADDAADVFERWRPFLHHHASRILQPLVTRREDASDIVQNTLLQVQAGLPQFRGRNRREWAAWLKQILVNEINKSYRYHSAHCRSVKIEVDLDNKEDLARCLSNMEEELESLERRAAVLDALEELSPLMQDVVRRRVFEQQTFAEIASSLGKPENGLRMVWSRAIKKIRTLVDEGNSEPT